MARRGLGNVGRMAIRDAIENSRVDLDDPAEPKGIDAVGRPIDADGNVIKQTPGSGADDLVNDSIKKQKERQAKKGKATNRKTNNIFSGSQGGKSKREVIRRQQNKPKSKRGLGSNQAIVRAAKAFRDMERETSKIEQSLDVDVGSFTGINKYDADYANYKNAYEKALKDFAEDVANFGSGLMREIAPVESGALWDAITHNVEKVAIGYRAEVYVGRIYGLRSNEDPNYPALVERGTGIYVGHNMITPNTADKMVFRWMQRGGGLYSFREVKGQPAQDYVDQTHASMDAYIADRGKQFAKEIEILVRSSNQ